MFVSSDVFSQIGTNSPYSRFGLGDLQNNVISEFSALGGGSTAIMNSKTINPYNPATYTGFGTNSFLFSTGGSHRTISIMNANESKIANNTVFSHVILGFPVNKKIGASIGILPYSNIGYELMSNDEDYDAELYYLGDGGISKIYFGGSYKLSDNLSIGINGSYLFGSLNRRKKLVFNDDSFLNSRANSKINLKGYYYELGLFYKRFISSDEEINFGFTANNSSEIRAKKHEIIETFEYSGILEVPKDTFLNNSEWGYAYLPKYINLGVSYIKDKKWIIVVDYSSQNWNDYILFDESDDLNNSTRISSGIQYTPDYNSVIRYYKRMQYRVGTTYINTPLMFGNNQLKEKNISFGFGFPIRKSQTKYDLAFILGERGTLENNLIKERFIRFGLTITYDGIWFVKRKYD